ncbi:DUF1501 domain-containing protein [Chitinimonas sp.]|uniref:DUF1501 domain-containing protein n=1 Tax=Chitinimonas sp. TaxID=1934313 RepID=UPI0035B321A7
MTFSRRDFLKAATLSAAAAPWGWMQALATTPATDDYKALVCIFLYGGNDGNNMLVPSDSGYTAYAAARGTLALPSTGLAALGSAASQGGKSFALHPALAPIAPLYQQGKLATLANVGTLVFPMTAAQYRARSKQTPYSLFSHSDQQHQWQSAESVSQTVTGWGGRIADAVLSSNGAATVPALMSIAGSSLFNNGKQTAPLVVPSSGSFGLRDNGSSTAAQTRNATLAKILGIDTGNPLVGASGNLLSQAIANAALINPIIQGSSATVSAAFSGVSGSLATQLAIVAKLIEQRAATGLKRQVFYVSLGGFDTHSNQLNVQQTLLGQLGNAMSAFYNATVALGLADKVTTFTVSDFARTLKPNSTGTDHAWGNHQLIMGGAVKGGDVYGSFPTLQLNGPDDADGGGRWVPTTSVDQYAATLASWLGVSAGDLQTVLPNLSRFASSNLGFV